MPQYEGAFQKSATNAVELWYRDVFSALSRFKLSLGQTGVPPDVDKT